MPNQSRPKDHQNLKFMKARNCSAKFSSLHLTILVFLIGTATSSINAAVSYATPLKGDEHMIGNLLEWTTAEEFNSEQFQVEKSLDGIEYEKIGKVIAAGESNGEKSYRFLDVNAISDRAYYRLKQIDNDGTISLSEIALVNRIISNNFMVVNMTNTSTNDAFKCAIDLLQDDKNISFELYNTSNEMVQSGTPSMFYGLNELEISLKDEAEGIYFLRLILEGELETLTLRKTLDATQTKENVALKEN